MKNSQALQLEALPQGVTLTHVNPDYPVLEIDHAYGKAKVALVGGHVLSWKPKHSEHEVFYVSPEALYQPGKAVRGGIPVCWPWFNAHASDASKPSHGFVRNQPWQLLEVTVKDETIQVVLEFHPETLLGNLVEGFEKVSARLVLEFGEVFKQELITTNHSQKDVSYEEALHTYFLVSGVEQVEVPELESTTYWDTVGTPCFREQSSPFTVSGEVDRQYKVGDVITLKDPAWRRSIVLEKYGSAEAVVWNPWAEKAEKLADLPNDGYLNFLCIETANTRLSPISLAAQSSHTTGHVVRVVNSL